MDDRVRAHAETLVDWSARIDPGDRVVVSVAEGAHDLAVAVGEALGDRGAAPLFLYDSDEVDRAYLRAADPGARGFRDATLSRTLYEAADATLRLGGGRNVFATADVPPATRQARATATAPAREARLATDWVSTVHPTRSLAQQAGMAHEPYREFVYGAVLRDWESLAEEMAQLKEIFDDGREVRLVGEGTDLTMSIAGRIAVNSAASVAYDSHNLPSGEVFTAPYAPEGVVRFDVPMTVEGRRVRDVRLVFEDGEVVEHDAAVGAAAIEEVLATDEGARRLGELGVGMNRGIDRATDNILFDEKMAGTVHLALGRAYDACVPSDTGNDGDADSTGNDGGADGTGNESAVHVDLITEMGEGSRLLVDGEVVQRDGVFRWGEGF